MYDLFIANKNYSSWSLRPWLVMTELAIPFREQLMQFPEDASSRERFRAFSPTGKVPCLRDGEVVVWDSLAIIEYLAERHAGVWPTAPLARAWARCAAAEMHSGFAVLRDRCTMNCGIRVKLHDMPAALEREISRLGELWSDGLERSGGPFLAGAAFSAVDAMFAPVAFRVQTYGLALDDRAAAYVARLLALPGMQRWYTDGLAERWREPGHEADGQATGTWTADLRAT
ncbi:MAG: glutathione S-transferase family protein [Deltaproteobacteria bacterium]|nr:glutathione S-transferase family protein [Deltaproteobacteria bacterium]